MTDQPRNEWQDYFREVQSYNTTIITVGYATFFGLLLFLKDQVKSPLVFWAGLLIIVSAGIFVSFELITQIKFAWSTRKAGKDPENLIRYWAFFFIPAVLFAVVAIALLLYLFLCNL